MRYRDRAALIMLLGLGSFHFGWSACNLNTAIAQSFYLGKDILWVTVVHAGVARSSRSADTLIAEIGASQRRVVEPVVIGDSPGGNYLLFSRIPKFLVEKTEGNVLPIGTTLNHRIHAFGNTLALCYESIFVCDMVNFNISWARGDVSIIRNSEMEHFGISVDAGESDRKISPLRDMQRSAGDVGSIFSGIRAFHGRFSLNETEAGYKEYEKEGNALYYETVFVAGISVFITFFILLCKLLWKVRFTYTDNAYLPRYAALAIFYCALIVIGGSRSAWESIVIHESGSPL